MEHTSTLVDAVDGVGTVKGESASAVVPRSTVVTVDADPHARRLNAAALRRGGYAVIDLPDLQELLDLLTSGAAVDCLVVAESSGRTLARRLIADARSVRRELRTILWEKNRPDGTAELCEAVAQLLVDAKPSRESGSPGVPRPTSRADRRRSSDS